MVSGADADMATDGNRRTGGLQRGPCHGKVPNQDLAAYAYDLSPSLNTSIDGLAHIYEEEKANFT